MIFFFTLPSIMPIIVLCFQKVQEKGREKSRGRRTILCLLDQVSNPENPLPLCFSTAKFNLIHPCNMPDTSHQNYSVGSFLFLKDFLGNKRTLTDVLLPRWPIQVIGLPGRYSDTRETMTLVFEELCP